MYTQVVCTQADHRSDDDASIKVKQADKMNTLSSLCHDSMVKDKEAQLKLVGNQEGERERQREGQ